MRITFVLPGPIRIPVGGAKVVYEHARGLAARGHEVHVVGPTRERAGVRAWVWERAVRARDRLHGVPDAPYYAASGVQTHVVPTASAAWVPDADAVIATGIQTASWVRDLPTSKGTKGYFIQHEETFLDPAALDTWHYPFVRITCARWLARRVEEEGEAVAGVVPNAIDPSEFFIERPVERRPLRVVALYHRLPVKGPDVLIEALERLKAALPAVEADVFAARRPGRRLPGWVRVHVRPDVEALRALYNGAAVFIHPSRGEGWPLVPMEAAACGCAVAASANEGISEYLTYGATMRAVPVGDGAALAEAAFGLLRHPTERIRLARAAGEAVARYRWPALTAHFEALLEGRAGGFPTALCHPGAP